MITLEITNADRFATAYRDEKPVATVQRVLDAGGPYWRVFATDGTELFSTLFAHGPKTLVRMIERALV